MVKSADRILQVLEFIVKNMDGVSHKELSAGLSIPKSSLSALLANLVDREYLSFSEMDKRYRLGPTILSIAGQYLSSLDIVQIGQPIVRSVMMETDESTEMAIRREDRIQIICKEDCSRPIQRVIKLGDTAPIYATAAGKAILAYLSDDEIDHFFSTVKMKKITKKTITDKKVLRQQMKDIRAGKLAYSYEELNEGLVAMAAPVFDLHGNAAASIVVPIPSIRFTSKKEKIVDRVLRKASLDLCHQLGFDWDTRAGVFK
jgi:DNA-binding IclR family transcriptional regulator